VGKLEGRSAEKIQNCREIPRLSDGSDTKRRGHYRHLISWDR